MTDDLLPCPFCGGNANARIWERDNGDAYAGVECTDCMADNSVALMWFDDGKKELAEAIAAWNRRAIPATGAREKTLHPDDMLPEAIRLIRQEATRDHDQDVVTGLKHIALLLEQLTGEARND